MKTNYKYSATPKRGDNVLIIGGHSELKFKGRTGTVVQGFKGMGKTTKLVEVAGMGIHRFYFKSLFKLSL